MNASQIVEEVTKHGGRIVVDGDKLKLSAPSPLPTDLLDEIKKAKAELLVKFKPLPHGSCCRCGRDTQSMLTKPTGSWAWMCSGCFERDIAYMANPSMTEMGKA